MTTTKVHYQATPFTNQVACGRYCDTIATLTTTANPAEVTCRGCLNRMDH